MKVAKMYYDHDADMSFLSAKRIAVLGYGSQGHSQALNLRDSGMNVVVGLRKGSSRWEEAEEAGLTVMSVWDACAQADVIQVLLPDEVQAKVYQEEILPNLTEGKALGFSHGFNIHFKQILPPPNVDVFMVAPKGPGHLLRRMYVEGTGVPAIFAVQQDFTGTGRELALSYAKAIGSTRAGVLETTFGEETVTDLFGEQAVLCGGMTRLIQAGFDILVEAGYQPEIAYFECLHEVKLIVDMIYEGGMGWMRYSVSDTCKFGDLTRGDRVITEDVKKELRKILKEVQEGQFCKDWILENQANRPVYNALLERERNHPIEKVGRELRKGMAWLNKDVKEA